MPTHVWGSRHADPVLAVDFEVVCELAPDPLGCCLEAPGRKPTNLGHTVDSESAPLLGSRNR